VERKQRLQKGRLILG